ncbi:hypothetical protein IMCC26134_02835 [Verrucomicrobia bacterium IMCC26134]|nr:hypothetical protein IMCC26134_02835 [Verrucomicrobia bacterium IMCC26134]
MRQPILIKLNSRSHGKPGGHIQLIGNAVYECASRNDQIRLLTKFPSHTDRHIFGDGGNGEIILTQNRYFNFGRDTCLEADHVE